MPPAKKWISKCPENQAALDRLVQHRDNKKSGDNNTLKDRYAMTLKKAMESLQQHPTVIGNFKEAKGLKYVGDHIASLICPPQKRSTTTPSPGASSVGSAASRKTPAAGAAVPSSSKRNLKLASIPEHHRNYYNETTTTATTIAIGKKQKVYDEIIATADNWKKHSQKQQRLTWRVVLLIDGREQQSRRMVAACAMSGIPCEVRMLPIADMGWIAQGLSRQGVCKKETIVTELVLGTLVERKTPEDLKSSLFGTRYQEQRLRLQHSGIPQILFLIEGPLRDLSRCPIDTLWSAIWETRLHKDFNILHTDDMTGTVRLLKRIHRRILQRSFPQAFCGSAPLPLFMEAASAHLAPVPGQRRVQSLAEMTFDTVPVPCFGMDRFVTYNELKAKVERDREAGTKTVRSIHLAMLKQVPTFSNAKCQAIAKLYPTPRSLLSADLNVDTIAKIFTKDPRESQKQATIGEKSARELLLVYGNSFQLAPNLPVPVVTNHHQAPVLVDSSTSVMKPVATQGTITKKPSVSAATIYPVPEDVVRKRAACAPEKAPRKRAARADGSSVGDDVSTKRAATNQRSMASPPLFDSTTRKPAARFPAVSFSEESPDDSLPPNYDFSPGVSSTTQRPMDYHDRSSAGFPSPNNDYYYSDSSFGAPATKPYNDDSITGCDDNDDDALRLALEQSKQQSNPTASAEENDEQQEVEFAIQRSLQDQKRQQRRVLNTSVGSLLDDSSTDDEVVPSRFRHFRDTATMNLKQSQEVIEID